MDNNKLWDEFLKIIKEKISTLSYQTWFEDTYLYSIKDNVATVVVPMAFHQKHLVDNYSDLIAETFTGITGNDYVFEFKLKSDLEEEEANLNDISDEENNDISSIDANLNPDYRFDSFIVGESNKFAFTAARAVAEQPGKSYNPLFLYGKSGLGKTHLMHSIGNYILENTHLKVLYISSDKFVNDYINAVRNNDKNNFDKIDVFKNKYRNIDVLMIDDIQFLGSANATQQEFTNTFNSLYSNSKQIIICSDRSVDDLKMFADRLKTRFNWGLKAIISVPDFDLKVKIIKNKIKTADLAIDLSDEIIDFMASNCGSDVRNLEGMITRLAAYSSIWGIQILSLENAMEALDEYVNGMGQYTENSIGKIINVVSEYFKLTPDDLKGKKRSKNIANARMIAMYLCRVLTDETYPRIGLEFGGRDHSTVIHGYDKINDDMKSNGELEKMISELKQKMSE